MFLGGLWCRGRGNNVFTACLTFITNHTKMMAVLYLLKGQTLNILGSGIQSVGAAIEASGHIEPLEINIEALGYNTISFGSFLYAIGLFWGLKGSDKIGNYLLLVGSWIQVIGGILVVYGLIN
jgi:hypothetical protein